MYIYITDRFARAFCRITNQKYGIQKHEKKKKKDQCRCLFLIMLLEQFVALQ